MDYAKFRDIYPPEFYKKSLAEIYVLKVKVPLIWEPEIARWESEHKQLLAEIAPDGLKFCIMVRLPS